MPCQTRGAKLAIMWGRCDGASALHPYEVWLQQACDTAAPKRAKIPENPSRFFTDELSSGARTRKIPARS